MAGDSIRIGIVAPGSRIEPEIADRVAGIAAKYYPERAVTLHFHPQCFLTSGHFAGDDASRAQAFVELANDPDFDAIWFARGGYGACRIAVDAIPRLTDAARDKTYLGYSDAGSLLAGLYRQGFTEVAHGPMPADILREGGEAAVERGLAYLLDRAVDALEPSVSSSTPTVAFNINILSHLLGTTLEPDLTGHMLLLEEVSEYIYQIDRSLFHITSCPAIRQVAGIRLGRCSQVPPNDPDFGQTEEEVTRHWCERSGIPYLGRADIGHDSDNKVVPFGYPPAGSTTA